MASPSDLLPVPVSRLSVIVPVLGPRPWDPTPERGLAEKAVQGVLAQIAAGDPVGTEILVVAEEGSESLEEAFRDERAQGRLEICFVPQTGDRARLKNLGAARCRGSILAFLDPRDEWRPGHLARIEPHLKRHDLLVCSDTELGETRDWIRAFVSENWATPSSLVVRRSLFEEVGGFPEGYEGFPIPRRIPGDSEYEFILRCLEVLLRSERRERFEVLHNETIQIGPREPGLPLPRLERRVHHLRETVSLLAVARRLPWQYWGTVLRRILR